MSIQEFISQQAEDRQELLRSIHELILATDKTVSAAVEPMMGKDMIIYNAPGTFKYALASVKKHMSLHLLPMYSSETMYNTYNGLLKEATFQKGCINFKTKEEVPSAILKNLLRDCSKINLVAMRNEQLKQKSKK